MLTAFTKNFVFYYFVCCLRFCSLHLNNILQIAETVRNTGKPSFQTLSLTSIPLNDSHTTYRGVFLAPPDTQFRFKGEMIGVTKGLLLYKLSWHYFLVFINLELLNHLDRSACLTYFKTKTLLSSFEWWQKNGRVKSYECLDVVRPWGIL